MTEIEFNSKDHTYWYDKKELVSVTTFISKFYKPFYKDEVAQVIADRQGLNKEEVLAEWNKHRELGVRNHALIESSLKSPNIPMLKLNQSEENMLQIVWDKILENNWFDLGKMYPELLVYDLKLGIAGTADLVFINHDKKQISIFDHKFMSKFPMQSYNGDMLFAPLDHLQDTKYNKYALQNSMYAYILQQMYPDYTIHQLANLVFMIKPIEDEFTIEDVNIYYCPYLKHDIENILFKS